MLRTAPRSATRPSRDRAAVELLDRTGIVAASLPRRRRTGGEVPAVEPIYTRPPVCDQDLRPKSVVIRRRARTWLGGGAAVLLVGAGWLGGGLFTGGLFNPAPEHDVAQLDARPAVAAAPAPEPPVAQAPPAPAVVTAAPETVYVPVPAKPAPKQVPAQAQAQAKPQPKKPVPDEEAEARVDLPSSATPPPASNPIQAWVDVAESMARRYGGR
ncbi:hypothetical protein AMES_0249 [Amycolatopsis mediterranei S699]|uniref:Uncharacterized protein n=2 Tax=Amycolatopsis mediterranei TaxID=33910 RepID=A0A0H3CTW3_AMYMU|nr:hypothetical protein [Amycolatopsis mediterranei]ADJ42077.1 hypothetical protein AMED_0254 [Amycolatopsis mediterranei U32]AEK38752.1 hypothetical protein RAM_01285 [Amycolatopsis mediterranei S699]AFO73785.1 hypothetical protein AMES_0249 [Amycolatopsis mediterranei S699]AGT80914.1 hypothetical protein B737_0250 [Amycolatopsis mediterranei RB]KDO08909.1 hypothetical protein DV26_21110 [Amycolatopsis mediterranei]